MNLYRKGGLLVSSVVKDETAICVFLYLGSLICANFLTEKTLKPFSLSRFLVYTFFLRDQLIFKV